MRLCFCCFVLFILSCNDLSNDINPLVDKPLESRSIVYPDVTDGILTFTDSTHFDNYYEYLYSIVKNCDNSDSCLSFEETRFVGFNSLRASSYMDSIPDHLFEEVIKSDFVIDDILKSILNNNYEFAVGNTVYVYTGTNQLFKILNWDYEAIIKFRHCLKGDSIPPVECFTSNVHYAYNSTEFETNSTIYDATPIVPRSIPVRINRAKAPIPACDNLWNQISAILEYYDGEKWKPYNNVLEWRINWGDGDSWVYLSPSVSDKHYFFFGSGTYPGYIEVKYIDPDFGIKTLKENITWVVFDRECKNGELNELRIVESGDIKMVAHSWFKESLGLRQGAETESWRKVNGNWRKKNAQLDVWCGANWFDFNIAADCAFLKYTEDNDHDSSSKQELVQMKQPSNGAYKDEFAPDRSKSTHRLEVPGVVLTVNMELNGCD